MSVPVNLRKFFHYFRPLKIMVKYFLETNGHKLCSKIEQILSDVKMNLENS
jgi:hypothetical protein